MARLRMAVGVAFLALLAGIPLACQQPAILSTISCPVYLPGETPGPNWPKQCTTPIDWR